MHSLAKNRVHQMANATGTDLSQRHLDVLEYAWAYYRKRRVGPLGNNIRRATGVTSNEIEALFPNGLSSVYVWTGIPVASTRAGCKPAAYLEVEDQREVYLDTNATTPVRKEVVKALVAFFENPRSYGNASSSYAIGAEAYDVIDQARRRTAACLGVDPGEVYFVGSGSEANNLAIKGIASKSRSGHIISTNVEHPSVQDTLVHLETIGYEVTYLPVAKDGTLAPTQVVDAMREDTILVTVMAANNEIGTIYPIAEIGAACRAREIPFAVDAIQGFGKIPISPKDACIDILTMSGHKIYAPKGVGAIYTDSRLEVAPQTHGGPQESGLRAGTENVAGIMAFGLAAQLAHREMGAHATHFLALRDHFLAALERTVPRAVINGTMETRLPHNLSVGFPGADAGSVLLSLDQIGVYVSAGSACSAGEDKISHVLKAIGADSGQYGTIRFSFSPETSTQDIDYLFTHLPAILEHLKSDSLRASAA